MEFGKIDPCDILRGADIDRLWRQCNLHTLIQTLAGMSGQVTLHVAKCCIFSECAIFTAHNIPQLTTLYPLDDINCALENLHSLGILQKIQTSDSVVKYPMFMYTQNCFVETFLRTMEKLETKYAGSLPEHIRHLKKYADHFRAQST